MFITAVYAYVLFLINYDGWRTKLFHTRQFMTWPKIRYPIYDLTITSKSCFRAALQLGP